MKKTLILLVCLLPLMVIAQTKPVKNFENLMEALETGCDVKCVFYYEDCQLISNNEIQTDSINAIGGFPIETWEFFGKGAIRNKEAFVVTSTSKLIMDPLGEGYVYNYVKVKISESGTVKITANYVDSVTSEELMTENFFTTIYDGENGAAHFFKK